jgi:hypothetical protein
MAASNEAERLAKLEQRLEELEGGGESPSPKMEVSADNAALIQAFFQGALVGNAAAQAGTGAESGTAPAFLSIFGCGGGGGWSPTNYDSVFWCKSRFMCNPGSLSCLC